MKRFKILLCMFFMLSLSGIAQVPFTAGNIVVHRVGDGVTTMGTTTTFNVFIEEYTPSGTFVQSFAIPTSGGQLTESGNGVAGGWISLSTNGQFLTFTGYDVPQGTTVTSINSGSTPRIIARVKYDGTINTTTALTDLSPTLLARGATSTNGIDLWAVGSNGAMRYATLGATTSTQLNTTPTAFNNVTITNGQLYGSSSSGTARLGTMGTGLPTTSGQTFTALPGFPTNATTYQFVLLDLDAGVAGPDVLYVADDGALGLSKYSLVAGTWTLNGTIGTTSSDYRGLTATVSGSTVTLYGTRLGSQIPTSLGGGDLFTLTDATGYNVNANTFTGTPTVLVTSVTGLSAFRGVALVPQAPSAKVAVKTFLQGAYNTGLSRHKDVTATWAAVLNANALSQPFSAAPFSYAGTESVASGFFTSTGGTTDITDWVLVELRDATTPSTVIARRAAFIREDGRVVDLDGSSDVSFSGVAAGTYHIVIRHRNHLTVRTSVAQALDENSPTLYDFGTAQSQAFQNGAITTNAAMSNLTGGVFGMWGGNANSNTAVRASGAPTVNDYLYLVNTLLGGNTATILSNVYSSGDLNLDGAVRASGSPTVNDYLILVNTILGGNTATIYTEHQ